MTIHFAKEDKAKFHIARLKRNGKIFEIHVDPEKALEFRNGKNIPIRDILLSYDIFKDVKKGDRASGLQETFGTTDVEKVAEIILREGELELTAEFLRKRAEQMRKEVITMIHENAIDAKTKLPIPIDVIERALDEAKVNINPNRSVKDNFDEAISKIRFVLPIKLETKKLFMRIPSAYASKSVGLVKRFAKILKEDWLQDGSLSFELEVTAGKYLELISQISKLTQGSADIKDLTQ
ncbi:MAG: ribosome assembly factor SBDS [Candidatus Woesearchaeota archaeon]